MTAGRNHGAFAWPRMDAHENRLEAERADPQAELIVLGHAAAGEGLAVLDGGKLGKRLASDGTAHAG